MREAAFNLRHKDYVPDHSAIQATTKYKVALACHRIHPGLCLSRDAFFYRVALGMARVWERYFVDERMHLFYTIYAAPPEVEAIAYDDFSLTVYACHKRARRSHAPATWQFLLYSENRMSVTISW